MELSAVQRCQVEFAAVWVATEIGDDDADAQEAFDEAFDVLTETKPSSLQDAAARLRCMAQIGDAFAGCEGTAERVRGGMIQVAAWLALEATAGQSAIQEAA